MKNIKVTKTGWGGVPRGAPPVDKIVSPVWDGGLPELGAWMPRDHDVERDREGVEGRPEGQGKYAPQE